MPRDAAAAPPRDAPPAVPTCSLCDLPLDQEQEDLGACFASLPASSARPLTQATPRAVGITCQAPACDKDTLYHSACVHTIYEKCTSRAGNNRVGQGPLEHMRLQGARAARCR